MLNFPRNRKLDVLWPCLSPYYNLFCIFFSCIQWHPFYLLSQLRVEHLNVFTGPIKFSLFLVLPNFFYSLALVAFLSNSGFSFWFFGHGIVITRWKCHHFAYRNSVMHMNGGHQIIISQNFLKSWLSEFWQLHIEEDYSPITRLSAIPAQFLLISNYYSLCLHHEIYVVGKSKMTLALLLPPFM